MQPRQGRKEYSVSLLFKIAWRKHSVMGIIIEIVLNLKKDKRNREEAHVSEMRKELDAKKSKKEEARDLHYD